MGVFARGDHEVIISTRKKVKTWCSGGFGFLNPTGGGTPASDPCLSAKSIANHHLGGSIIRLIKGFFQPCPLTLEGVSFNKAGVQSCQCCVLAPKGWLLSPGELQTA